MKATILKGGTFPLASFSKIMQDLAPTLVSLEVNLVGNKVISNGGVFFTVKLPPFLYN
jgi:hypothetical protein